MIATQAIPLAGGATLYACDQTCARYVAATLRGRCDHPHPAAPNARSECTSCSWCGTVLHTPRPGRCFWHQSYACPDQMVMHTVGAAVAAEQLPTLRDVDADDQWAELERVLYLTRQKTGVIDPWAAVSKLRPGT